MPRKRFREKVESSLPRPSSSLIAGELPMIGSSLFSTQRSRDGRSMCTISTGIGSQATRCRQVDCSIAVLPDCDGPTNTTALNRRDAVMSAGSIM